MNKALEISLDCLEKMECLQNRSRQQIIAILTSIPFLKYEEDKTVSPSRKSIRLAYNFSQNILIITGMSLESLNLSLNHF